MSNGDTIVVSAKDGALFLDGGEGLWKMYFTSAKDFFVFETRAAFSFITDAGGRVTGFTIDNRLTAKKIE